MNEFTLYDHLGAVRLTALLDDSSSNSWGIMEDNRLTLTFTYPDCVALAPGDYADFDGMRFWLAAAYKPKQNSASVWAYSVNMTGVEGLLAQTLVLDTTDGKMLPVFQLTGPAREHAALIVDNINRRLGTTDWKVGEVVSSENIDMDYTGKYCTDALRELADQAKTEWWIDGLTLNVSRCEFGEPTELGYDNGLLGEIEQTTADNAKFYTRLYPVGSTRNIVPTNYKHANLQLPGGRTYIDLRTELGIIEHFESEAFADIYPRRIGTVSYVRSKVERGENGKDFTVYYFRDANIDFNPNDYMTPDKMQVTFQSGELTGREFEIANYDPQTREFEIVTIWPFSDDTQLPGGLLVPAINDTYILWNITMPAEYYPRAEREFLAAAEAFAAEANKDVALFRAQTDYIEVQRRGLKLRPGQRIRLQSREFFPTADPDAPAAACFRDSRITRITRPVGIPEQVRLEISDVRSTGTISRLENQIREVNNYTRLVSSEFPDLIHSWEQTPVSDTTVNSSRRSDNEFLNKRRPDTAQELTTFRKGLRFSEALATEDFRQDGFAGAGAGIYTDANGQRVLEVDKAVIRRSLDVNEVVINQISHIGGRTIYSAANMECIRVGEQPDAYRCYMDTRDGQRHILFTTGDQAYCQRYDPASNNIIKYYWRLVTATGGDWIDLSKSDADGVDIPAAGDNIVQIGHRSDARRQAMLEINQLDGGSVVQYAGIDTYNFNNREQVGFGYDPGTGRAKLFGFGDVYIGDRENTAKDSTFITFQPVRDASGNVTGPSRLTIKGDLHFTENSDGISNLAGFSDLDKKADDATAAAIKAGQDAARAQDILDQINSDIVFDVTEKRDIRTKWENINGKKSLSQTQNNSTGSYWTTLAAAAALNNGTQLFTAAEGEEFLVQK